MGNIATCSCYGRGKDADDLAPLLGAKINRANDRNNDAIINFMRRDSQLTTDGTGDLTNAAGTIEAAEAVLGDDPSDAAGDHAGTQGRPRAASGGGGGGDAEDERARDPVMELGIDLGLPDAMKDEQRRQSLTSGSSKDKLNQFDFSDSDNDDNNARGGGGHSSASQQASDAEALARHRLAQEQQQQAQGSNEEEEEEEEEDERAKAAAAAAKAQQEAEARKVLEALEKHQQEQEEQEAAERAAAAKAEEEAARAAEEAERQAAAAREAERLKALKEEEEAAAEAKRKEEEERKEAEMKKKKEEEERKRKEEEAAAAAKAKEEAAKKKPKFTFSKVTKPKISLVKVSPDDKKKEEEEKKRREAEEQRRQEQAAAEEEARRRKEEEDKALARLAREDSLSLQLSDVDDDEQSRVRSATADSAGPYNPVSGVSAIDDDDEISTRGRVLGTIAGSGSTQQLEQKKEQQLLLWVRKYTIGYQNVQVQDFDRSWRDGMAFLALIHSFYPEYIGPFDKKSPRNAVDNLQTAFKVAEEKLDVYPLLDVDDLDEANETDAELVRSYVESLQRVLDPDSA